VIGLLAYAPSRWATSAQWPTRQYFPKGTRIAGFTQDQLDEIAAKLNGRPRQILGWMTLSVKLDEVLR
jgi:IS30 family transposase